MFGYSGPRSAGADGAAPNGISSRQTTDKECLLGKIGVKARFANNGRLRDELLNETLFSTLSEARQSIHDRKEDYNRIRPHSALGKIPPEEYAIQFTLEKQTA